MKRMSFLFLWLTCLPLGFVFAQAPKESAVICFDTPPTPAPKAWEAQTLPIGNGSIGANIYGAIAKERITLNEKSLWLGGPNTAAGPEKYWQINKKSAAILPQIRAAFEQGDTQKATLLTQENFNSTVSYVAAEDCPFRFGNYTSMGAFDIATGCDPKQASEYSRWLSLDSALVTVRFKQGMTTYTRQSFISYPDQVMVIRFTCDQPQAQKFVFNYQPIAVATGQFYAEGKTGLLYKGYLNNNHMRFALRIQALCEDGEVKVDQHQLVIQKSSSVTFLVTADTDYKLNFKPDFTDAKTYVGVDPLETTQQRLTAAVSKGYAGLLETHLQDYQRLFHRVKLTLNPTEKSPVMDTPKRLARYRKGAKDSGLEALYYQYGRYLLIASSRTGNLPANLQGIWSEGTDGPWHVDYHNNINLQMNYWPVCSTNLDECATPLIDFIRSLVKPGQQTAKNYFGARGWTTSISSNIFGFTTPLSDKNMAWNFCPMAGPWLATHLWTYYDYTRDTDFLAKTGYPLLKQAAFFTEDYLWHKPDGSYTAAPSTSPEHGPVDQGATFVHAVVRELLTDAIKASEVLDTDETLRDKWKAILIHLKPYQIGRYGQLMEWSSDLDDPLDHHRHVNHLFGLYPGHTISTTQTPELAQAAKTVLVHRGDLSTGWSMGWRVNMWAHLKEGNHAYKLLGELLKNGTNDNLWDTHPPFQIDGNFGGTSGITEMLLQSQDNRMELLPALPDDWADGEIKGIQASGAIVVDLTWQHGRLTQAVFRSKVGGSTTITYEQQTLKLQLEKNKSYRYAFHNGAFVLQH